MTKTDVIIENKTKKTILVKKAKICGSILSKTIGLMFSKRQNKALIFYFKKNQKISLHMLFVFYPIDVLFLDKNKIVVDIVDNFRPFTFYTSKEKAVYAVELPADSIRKSRTKVGDKINFYSI